VPSVSTVLSLKSSGKRKQKAWDSEQLKWQSTGTVSVEIFWHNASNPSHRVGALIFNPGGPDGNASMEVQVAKYSFLGLYEYFDIVGLDPRGVGASSPIKCDPEIYNQTVSEYPTNESEIKALVTKNKTLEESCLNMTGSLVAHMESVSLAKDMEPIRVALGDAKLNDLDLTSRTLIGA
jgi:pimeloyl-ACP methyl ester carboxylesterase